MPNVIQDCKVVLKQLKQFKKTKDVGCLGPMAQHWLDIAKEQTARNPITLDNSLR